MRASFTLLISLFVPLIFSAATINPSASSASPHTETSSGTSTAGYLVVLQSTPVRQPDTPVSIPGNWPQPETKRTPDITQLKTEAQELAALSQVLADQIDKFGKGQLPKDLVENLRKIEKLSKRIRIEIS